MNIPQTTKQRGRPPAFNREQALEQAMNIFWAHGYEGASMALLTEAMGINKPSLYGAFGSKQELFRKVVEKYLAGPAAYVAQSINQPTVRQVVEQLLTQSAEFLTSPHNPQGCMVMLSALTCGQGAELIQQEMIAHRRAYENALRQRFALAQAQHDLPQDIDPAQLAKYIATLHQGMSIQAASGASRQELLAVAGQALKNWPVGTAAP